MNSRQRRVDRRHWCHSISMEIRFDHYIEMWNWLAARHGKKARNCGWRQSSWRYADHCSDIVKLNWQFEQERDLLEFVLRWS